MNSFHHFLVRRSQEQFSSINLPIYKIAGLLPLLFISEFSKTNLTSYNHDFYKTWNMLISRWRQRNQPDCILHVQLFFSWTPLFGGVLHDFAVEVFLNSLHYPCSTKTDILSCTSCTPPVHLLYHSSSSVWRSEFHWGTKVSVISWKLWPLRSCRSGKLQAFHFSASSADVSVKNCDMFQLILVPWSVKQCTVSILWLNFNHSNPSIKLKILLLCFHAFLTEVVGRSCWNITWVIMFSIPMTSLTDKALILRWEVRLRSLLGLKGLT